MEEVENPMVIDGLWERFEKTQYEEYLDQQMKAEHDDWELDDYLGK